MTTQADDRLLWPEEVAEIAGIDALTVRKMLSQAKKRRRNPKPGDLPMPDAYKVRQIRQTPTRTAPVKSPQWRESTIAAWLPTKRGVGRPRLQQPTDN
jgi:hypothetical protein